MKKIYLSILFFAFLFSFEKVNAQVAPMGCFTPSLGVYDDGTNAAISATISCNAPDWVVIRPSASYSGTNACVPCININLGTAAFPTNFNSQTNNSLTVGEGTNLNVSCLAPSGCFTFVPNSTQYAFRLAPMDPTLGHGYNLCNTAIATSFPYSVTSCYSSAPLVAPGNPGNWQNNIAANCQTVTIPAGAPIGLASFTVSPAVPSTASLSAPYAYLYLDTWQMIPGTYTITYFFDSQAGCTVTQTRTISITNPYSATWSAPAAMCANGACVNLVPQLSGTATAGGTFTAPAGVSSNSFCPGPVGAGTYPVTYVVGVSPQCSANFSTNITVNALPVANAGSTQSLTCVAITTVLAGSGGGTYAWTGPGIISGGTTASPVVGTAGTYSLTVTSGGCTSLTNTVAVGTNTTPPSPTAGTSASVTCSNNAINLTSNPGSMNYTWTAPGGSSITGGVNNQNTTASGPGTYTVRVVNPANGCFATTTVAAQINTVAPVTSAGTTGSITCNNTTINLTNTLTGVTYTWIAPGGSSITGGVNSQNTTGSGAGTYTVRVQSAVNGCTAIATVAALVNTINPSPTAGTSGSVTCNNTAITLTSTPSSGVTYTWTAPGGSSITGGVNTQNTTGSGAGTYTVRVTDAVNGCTNIATVAALINTTTPVGVNATSTGSVTCSTNTVSLNGAPSSGGTYTWTAPGGSSITGGVNNQNTTGSGPGTYTLVFQSSVSGCTASAVTSIGFNTVVPTGITPSTSGTVTCAPGSNAINLGVTPTGLTYSWTAPAGSSITSGATSSSATGSGGGTYSVVVTGTNGCSAAVATIVANTNTTAPTQTAIPSQSLTCSTSSLNIIGNPSSGVLYSWLGTGIVGPANTQTVNVVISGNYTLVVTSTANSCTSSAIAAIGTNTTPPAALGSGSVSITCATPSVTLIGSATPSSCTVVWTGGVCAGATSYTATACAPGNYSMTVTNPANGCPSAPAVFTVVPNASIPTATLVNTATITCVNTTAQVIATTTTSPVTYTWSGPGIVSGSNTSTITVNQGGVYTLTLTSLLNSCVSIITNSVTNDNAAITPTVAASNTITCSTTTVNMTANGGVGTFTYNWSGSGIVGTNTLSSATSSLGGTYNVTVTNTSNGCVGVAALTVNSSTTVPSSVSVSASTLILSCSTSSAALTATAVGASTYSWIAPATGAITSGSAAATATINGPGTYSVVVTGTNGCSAPMAMIAISPNTLAPTFVLSNSSPSITCLTASPIVSVNITSTVGISSYSWSPASGISGSATGSVVTFTTAGTYTGVITASNGCISNAIVTVVSATAAPMFVVGTGTASNISCANPTVVISPVYTPTTDITFVWSGPGIVGSTTNSSVSVNQNGQYSVTVTNTVTGCSSTSLTVDVFGTTVVPTLTISSTSTIGLGCSLSNSTNTLTANASAAVTYSWNTGATTQTISVNTPGIYTVVVTNTSTSCSSTETISVLSNTAAPTATSVANAIMPCGGTATVTLNGGSPDPNVVYTWNGPGTITGSTTGTPTVDTPGSFTLTVTNTITGCSSTSSVNVSNSTPVATFTPDITSGFAPQVVVFTNGSTSTPSVTYTWNFGDGNTSTTYNATNTYTLAGTYTVSMVVASGACTATATAVIVIQDGFSLEIPNVFTPNDDNTNDVFTIKSTGVKEISLQIFNRWGQLMYEFTGAKAAWDGITNNGQKATDGTYFYFVVATGFDSTKEPVKKNGAVSLFR